MVRACFWFLLFGGRGKLWDNATKKREGGFWTWEQEQHRLQHRHLKRSPRILMLQRERRDRYLLSLYIYVIHVCRTLYNCSLTLL
jgi:hypothetical protein